MKKNFTQLIAGVHIARYYEVSIASMLLLFFMLLANAATAQTVSGMTPKCAIAGQTNFSVTVTGSGFTISGGNPVEARLNNTQIASNLLTRTSTTEISIAIPNSYIAQTGTVLVEVGNKSGNSYNWQIAGTIVVIGAPSVQGASRCGSGTVTLTASGAPAGAAYQWYDASNNPIASATNSTYTTPVISATTAYKVAMTAPTGCVSTQTTVTATVNTIPNAPTTTSNSRCGDGSVQLAASGAPANGSYRWYTTETGGTAISGATTATFTTPHLTSTTTYYVSTISFEGCESTSRTAVTATINPIPAAPTVLNTDVTRCGTGQVTLSSNVSISNFPASGATNRWYDASGNELFTGEVYSPTLSDYTQQTFYVGSYNTVTGCESTQRIAVTARAIQIPVASVSAGSNPTTFCIGGSVLLTAEANPVSGTYTYQWRNGNTDIPGAANATYTATESGDYNVVITNEGKCPSSPSAAVAVTVNPLPVATIGASGPTTFCQGGSVTLTAQGGTSWLWSNGATTQSIDVNTSGTFTVKVTDANTCTSPNSEPVTVTVNPLPVATIDASGPTTFCQGGSVTLTAQGGTSWLWSNGATTQSIDVNASGTFTVKVTDTNTCTSPDSEPVTVTVNPIPNVPAVAGDAVCDQGEVTLSATVGTDGNLVRWYTAATGGNPIATGDTYTTSVSSTTSFYASSYNTNTGCESARIEVIATVNPLPTVSITPTGPLEFCEGNSVVLEPTPLPATDTFTYAWFNASDNTQVSADKNYVAYDSGDYYLVVTNQNGCQQTSGTLTVIVAEIPTEANITLQGPSTFCAESSVKLSANKAPSGQSYDYQWYKNDVAIDGAISVDYIATESGNYKVEVTNLIEGCSKISPNVTVTELPQPTAAITSGNEEKCIGSGNTTVFAVTGDFSGGTAQWLSSNSNFVISNPVYNSATGKATATVTATGLGASTITLKTTNSASNCTPASNTVSLTVNPLPNAGITVNGATTFCLGGSVELSAISGNYSYQWYRNGGTITTNGTDQTYSATTTGNYTVRVTNNATGCVATTATAVPVTVNPQPVVSSASASQASQCVGAGDLTPFNLTGSVSNGTAAWSVVSTSGITNVAFADASSPNTTVTLTGIGTATVRLSSSSNVASCNTDFKDVTLTVNPYPTANAGIDQALCAGTSYTRFTRSASGNGATISWSVKSADPGVSVSNLAYPWIYNSFVDITGVGSVVLTMTVTSNGCTTSDDVVYTVKPMPVITAIDNKTYCNGVAGEAINFESSVAGSTITWTSSKDVGFGLSGTGDIPAYTATNTTTSTLSTTVTVNATVNGCTAAQKTFTITVYPTPKLTNTLTPPAICSGTSFSYNATVSPGGAVATWSRAEVAGISNAAATGTGNVNETLTNTTTTDKVVTYVYTIAANGCTNTQNVTVTVKPKPDPTFTGVTDGQVFYSGDGTVNLTGQNPSNGTFSGPGVSGTTFTPCNALSTGVNTVTVPITYTVTVNGCTNSITKIVTVKRSTYTVVVTAVPMPFCRGDNVTYTTKIFRDVTSIVYPYLVDNLGRPVDGNGNLVSPGSGNLPVANPAYPFPAGTPDIIKAMAYRFFEPIVTGGTLVNGGANAANFDYQWHKNETVDRKNDGVITTDAGLSSMDYYGVYVTSKSGSNNCVPTLTGQISDRKYSAEMETFSSTLTANPICQAGTINFTATLNSAFPYWSIAGLSMELVRTRGDLVIGSATYDGSGSYNFSINVPGTDLVNGDEVYIRFNSIIDDYRVNSKCAGRPSSNVVTIQIDQPVNITTNLSTTAQNKCVGETATYTVNATGTGLQFVWYKVGSSTPLVAGGNISITNTTTSSTLTISSVTEANGGKYYAKISNAATSVCATSAQTVDAELNVNPLPLARTVLAPPFCPVNATGSEITLENSEAGVDYTLVQGTTTLKTMTGNGGTISFGTYPEGTYNVSALNANGCNNPAAGSITVTSTTETIVTGDLQITWLNEKTQWEIIAYSDHADKTGLEYDWYIGAGDTDPTTTTVNKITIDNEDPDLVVKCIIRTTRGECIRPLEMDNSAITPLPVEIIYLTAQKQGYNVMLEWATAMEKDNAGFEIQVSQDGHNYRKLDFVTTKNGNSSQKQVYKYVDKENGKYGTRYYRLKQTDVSGQVEYFGPKVVEFGSVTNKTTVYPNPFVNKIELNIEAEQEGQMEIILSNSIGKQLIQKIVMVEKGLNTEQLILESNLPQGVYFVTTRMGSVTNHFKLLKQ